MEKQRYFLPPSVSLPHIHEEILEFELSSNTEAEQLKILLEYLWPRDYDGFQSVIKPFKAVK